MNNFLECIVKHAFFFWCSEKGYAALFKAGIALLGLTLLGLNSSVATFLYEKDNLIYKAKYTLEVEREKAGKKPLNFEQIDCKSETEQVECLMAKHEMELYNSTLQLFGLILNASLYLGGILLVLSCLGFLLSPYSKNENKSSSP